MYIFDSIQSIISTFFRSIALYLPNLIGGVIILSLGLVLSQIVRQLVTSLFSVFRLDELLRQARVGKKDQVKIWQEFLTELAGWTVIILFLVPAAEVWGLSKVSDVLNHILYYIPNVLVAVVIGCIGLVIANLVADFVRQSVKSVGASSSATLSAMSRYAIIFFTVLIVLNQLGVAQDLIRILFTGIVAMVAIAGGLAFGLGGQKVASETLEELRKSLK